MVIAVSLARPHRTLLIRTTSLTWMPRDMARRLSGETPKEKIKSDSKDVSFLGGLPSSGVDQMFPIPRSLRAYRIDFPSGAQVKLSTSPEGTGILNLFGSPPEAGTTVAQS